MVSGLPDWHRSVRLTGKYGTDYIPIVTDENGNLFAVFKGSDGVELRTVRVDTEGRIVSLMTGAGGVALAVDEEGRIRAVMQGEHDTTLRTLKTDEEGRLQAVMVGSYEGTPVPVATDADGRLKIVDLYQNSIMPDETEAQTWDDPIGSLLSNLNRIRYAIVHMSGEAWGTFSHSIAEIWGKFDATDGHKHSGAADDGGQVDHGTLGGLGDDDHPQYFRVDGTRKYEHTFIQRATNDSYLVISGGSTGWGKSASIDLYGGDHPTTPAKIQLVTTAADGVSSKLVMVVYGKTDSPEIDVVGNKIVRLGEPTAATDAATKGYVDSSAIARPGMILAWSGSVDNIPSGWLLCDGTNNTPDLRDRFVVGAGSSYNLGDTGGEATHTLTVDEIPSHTHQIGQDQKYVCATPGETYVALAGSGTTVYWNTDATGGGQAHENRPPYYALFWIMKA